MIPDPISSKPGLQVKVAVSPTEVPVNATLPLAGSTRTGHRAKMEKLNADSSLMCCSNVALGTARGYMYIDIVVHQRGDTTLARIE